MEEAILDRLHPEIRKLIKEIGFKELTDTQISAIPKILDRKDVLIVAPTGSGKTEAALIPILSMMISDNPRPISVLYITPLRALNRDLVDRISWWTGKLDYKVYVRHGDTATRERRLHALSPPDIMLTTPETFALLLNAKIMATHLQNVKWVIIDEVHELVDNKRGTQLSIALERLKKIAGNIQIIGLSATIGSIEEVTRFLGGLNRNVELVEIDVTKQMAFNVMYPTPLEEDYRLADELYTYPGVAARIRVIRDLIDKHRATLIFTNTRPMAEVLSSRLHLLNEEYPASVHHGSLSASKRIRVERALKRGKLKGVICTSSLELGIDIGDIDLVIQYNSPRQVTRLIQRVGRSGHWIERLSKGAIIVQDPDDALESIVIVNRAKRGTLEPLRIPEKPYDVLVHEIAGLLIRRYEVSLKDIYEILRNCYVYRNLEYDELRELARFISGLTDRIWYFDENRERIVRGERKGRLFQYYFETLSMIPEIRQYIVINELDGLPIGILDGEFVSEYGEPGFKFIMAGRPWKIIQVFKDRVYVKPEDDPLGAIPFWIGEEIPVLYDVANQVGKIKFLLENLYLKYRDPDKVIFELSRLIGVDHLLLRKSLSPYIKMLERGYVIPTDKRIVLEKYEDKIFIHIHGGTLINRTISLFLVQAIFDIYGETIYVSSDPYRIILSSTEISPGDIKRLFTEISRDKVRNYIVRGVEETTYFRWRLLQVARRMGIISGEVQLDPVITEQLVTALRDTPAYKEALKESLNKDRDLSGAVDLIRQIQEGEISVDIIEGLEESPLIETYLIHHEIRLEPGKVDRLKTLQILGTRVRLLNEIRTFVCMNCFNYVEEYRIKELSDKPICPECHSRKIGMSEELIEEVMRIIEISKENRKIISRTKIWKELTKTSKLIEKYGKVAALVLSANISIEMASKILETENKISGRLFRIIMEEERKALLHRFR